ncbi:HNH endonuclease [Mycobacterium phage IkeLoa]|uniref:HNH endonuclease n=2 Tax=Bixzunavirus hyro TaxID=2006136 RepID=A0A7M1CRK7_9CAUD|nr:HNH endonuclease [Mycobacterium phage HyRo]QDF16434.1 HNH endonuclease [Mycobacterium phage Blackbrain]QOP67042.1 HNH endonuclease [Mycobacterium phage Shifa]URP21494.1 HNH endonuclease [Mycobacterium phage McGee]UVD40550.1 HNH endonuclease [Mycobacterium phage IkeLoa]ALA48377.1 HNH endonuclease [Mycobacterium phage HyRo]
MSVTVADMPKRYSGIRPCQTCGKACPPENQYFCSRKCRRHSAETKERVGASLRGVPKPPRTDEHRRNMSLVRIGKPHPRHKTAEECFWEKVDRQSGECWLWTGSINNKGYGTFRGGYAHRFSYRLIVGDISVRAQLDHRTSCVSRCVNPYHLRVVTNKQNGENRRGPNRNSKSGVLGVFWNTHREMWQAAVTHNGKRHHAGFFHDLEEAEAAVVAKRLELFTHNDSDRRVP